MNFLNFKLALFLILSLGLFLRIVNINHNPPSLYGDELTIILDSKSILETGQDQTGAYYPLTFSMGAGRPAGYVYGSIPFVAIFGESALGVRGLSIMSGIGLIYLLFYLGKRFFSAKVGLIAALLCAISPWDLSLSRGGFEAHFGLFLALLSVVSFLGAEKRKWLYIVSALSFAVSIHTYPTYKLTLPLVAALLLWYRLNKEGLMKQWFSPTIVISVVILIIAITASAVQTFTGVSETRFWQINLFAKEDLKESIIQNINYERNIDSLPRQASELFHNKFLEYSSLLGEAYLQNFSLDFLFLHGDGNPRHNMTTSGGFYLIEILTILTGFVLLLKRKKEFILLIGWILIGPLPTTALLEPHALRNSFLLPPIILLSASGLFYLISQTKLRNIFIVTVTASLLIQGVILADRLYFLAPNKFSNFWAHPAKQASEYILENKNKYSNIIVSGRLDNIEFAYPVYAKISPNVVIEQNKRKQKIGEHEFKKFDNVYIGSIPESKVSAYLESNPSTLYIGSIEERDSLKDSSIILGIDGRPAFIVATKN